MNENTPFSEKLRETVEVIDEAYEKYGYIHNMNNNNNILKYKILFVFM